MMCEVQITLNVLKAATALKSLTARSGDDTAADWKLKTLGWTLTATATDHTFWDKRAVRVTTGHNECLRKRVEKGGNKLKSTYRQVPRPRCDHLSSVLQGAKRQTYVHQEIWTRVEFSSKAKRQHRAIHIARKSSSPEGGAVNISGGRSPSGEQTGLGPHLIYSIDQRFGQKVVRLLRAPYSEQNLCGYDQIVAKLFSFSWATSNGCSHFLPPFHCIYVCLVWLWGRIKGLKVSGKVAVMRFQLATVWSDARCSNHWATTSSFQPTPKRWKHTSRTLPFKNIAVVWSLRFQNRGTLIFKKENGGYGSCCLNKPNGPKGHMRNVWHVTSRLNKKGDWRSMDVARVSL